MTRAIQWAKYIAARVLIGLFVALIVYVLVGIVASARLDARCAKLGWPSSSFTFTLESYCVARTNQTDIIIPLDSAERLGSRRTP